MAKLKLPFELEKPSPDTFATRTSEIGHGNAPLDGLLDDLNETAEATLGNNGKSNNNSTKIEDKVNTLISCLEIVIKGVAWWDESKVPYNIPEELLTQLRLLRLTNTPSGNAICGQVLCGQVLCGQNV